MIYILNDIKFGHPKIIKHQIDYFNSHFLPNAFKNKSTNDKLIITGDLFYNNKHVTFKLLSEVLSIFEKFNFLKIEIIGNEYCYDIIKEYVTQIEKIEYNIDKISLFQFSHNDTNIAGFYAIKKDKPIIIHNKYSPSFVEYFIKNIEDLNKVEISKDFINLKIDKNFIDYPQNKNTLDIFINNNPDVNIYYIEDDKSDDDIIINNKNINIRDIIYNNINENLKEELSEIFSIYDETKI